MSTSVQLIEMESVKYDWSQQQPAIAAVVTENRLFFDHVGLIPTASTGCYPLVINRQT
jgi:hypothetical protein